METNKHNSFLTRSIKRIKFLFHLLAVAYAIRTANLDNLDVKDISLQLNKNSEFVNQLDNRTYIEIDIDETSKEYIDFLEAHPLLRSRKFNPGSKATGMVKGNGRHHRSSGSGMHTTNSKTTSSKPSVGVDGFARDVLGKPKPNKAPRNFDPLERNLPGKETSTSSLQSKRKNEEELDSLQQFSRDFDAKYQQSVNKKQSKSQTHSSSSKRKTNSNNNAEEIDSSSSTSETCAQLEGRITTTHTGRRVAMKEKTIQHEVSKHGHTSGIDDVLPRDENQKPTKYPQVRTRVNNENKDKMFAFAEDIIQDAEHSKVYSSVSWRGTNSDVYYNTNPKHQEYAAPLGTVVIIPNTGNETDQIAKIGPIGETQLEILRTQNRID